jgi:Family of unknown function (DUF6134)
MAVVARQAAAALPVPPGGTLAFRLLRHGSEIGRHTLSFATRDDIVTVTVAVDAVVSFINIPLVRYQHRVLETWQGDRLISLTGETDKNGQHEWVNAHRTAEGLVVLGSKTARYVAPEPAIGTSYWNRRMLEGAMISLEDGVLLRPKVTLRRAETVKLASGNTTAADHYNLSGAFNVDVWYDAADTWASLAFSVADGSTVHYERL